MQVKSLLWPMLGHTYASQNCSAARALELVGERWSLLILRDSLFRGIKTFGDFQKSLGIATNILTTRLETFVANGLLVFDAKDGSYHPSQKALEFKPVIMALTHWGDKWSLAGLGPIEFRHDDCAGKIKLQSRCDLCGDEIENSKIKARARVANS